MLELRFASTKQQGEIPLQHVFLLFLSLIFLRHSCQVVSSNTASSLESSTLNLQDPFSHMLLLYICSYKSTV